MVGSGNPVVAHTNCATCPAGTSWKGGVGETTVGGAVPDVLENSGSVMTRMEELEAGPAIPQTSHVYTPESETWRVTHFITTHNRDTLGAKQEHPIDCNITN